MLDKAERTRDKYAGAAAELDILYDVLGCMNDTIDLLPDDDINFFIEASKRITDLKLKLDSQAAEDFGAKTKTDKDHIKFIFFNSAAKELSKKYNSRYEKISNYIASWMK